MASITIGLASKQCSSWCLGARGHKTAGFCWRGQLRYFPLGPQQLSRCPRIIILPCSNFAFLILTGMRLLLSQMCRYIGVFLVLQRHLLNIYHTAFEIILNDMSVFFCSYCITHIIKAVLNLAT